MKNLLISALLICVVSQFWVIKTYKNNALINEISVPPDALDYVITYMQSVDAARKNGSLPQNLLPYNSFKIILKGVVTVSANKSYQETCEINDQKLDYSLTISSGLWKKMGPEEKLEVVNTALEDCMMKKATELPETFI